MNRSQLHQALGSVARTGIDKGMGAVLDVIQKRVYRDPRGHGFDDEDDAADALLKYRHRIDRLVLKYLEDDRPFDSYLDTSLRFMARSIRRDRRRNLEKERVCECFDTYTGEAVWPGNNHGGTGFPHATAAPEHPDPRGRTKKADSGPTPSGGEDAPPLTCDPVVPSQPPPRAALERLGAEGRRILFLVLKCAWELDEESLSAAASAIGVSLVWLAGLCERVKSLTEGEWMRFDRMAASRNASWTRLYTLSTRLCSENDPAQRSGLETRIARERARLGRIRVRMGRFNSLVPNSVISRVLGIPKGTIDSGLYYLRKRRELCDGGKRG